MRQETTEELRLAEARFTEARANVKLVEVPPPNPSAFTAGCVAAASGSIRTRSRTRHWPMVATRTSRASAAAALRGYQRILAPFDGLITRRGKLIPCVGRSQAQVGVALFEVADTAAGWCLSKCPMRMQRRSPGLLAQVFRLAIRESRPWRERWR